MFGEILINYKFQTLDFPDIIFVFFCNSCHFFFFAGTIEIFFDFF